MSYLRAVILHSYSVKRKRANYHSATLRSNAELHQYQPIPASGWFWGQGIQEIVCHHVHYYLFPGDIFKGTAGFQGLLFHWCPLDSCLPHETVHDRETILCLCCGWDRWPLSVWNTQLMFPHALRNKGIMDMGSNWIVCFSKADNFFFLFSKSCFLLSFWKASLQTCLKTKPSHYTDVNFLPSGLTLLTTT